jgi:hypothetical protein
MNATHPLPPPCPDSDPIAATDPSLPLPSSPFASNRRHSSEVDPGAAFTAWATRLRMPTPAQHAWSARALHPAPAAAAYFAANVADIALLLAIVAAPGAHAVLRTCAALKAACAAAYGAAAWAAGPAYATARLAVPHHAVALAATLPTIPVIIWAPDAWFPRDSAIPFIGLLGAALLCEQAMGALALFRAHVEAGAISSLARVLWQSLVRGARCADILTDLFAARLMLNLVRRAPQYVSASADACGARCRASSLL